MDKNKKLIREVDKSELPEFDYPSSVVAFKLSVGGQTVEVKIPKNELPRVKEIFESHDYAVLPMSSQNSPGIIVDIGANVGIFTLYMKMNYPESQIYCFEPVPSTIELLRQNLQLVSDTYIFPFGLFNDNKTEKIQIHATNSGANSIKVNENSKANFTSTIDIELKKASEIFDKLGLQHISILKIDTEGCEVEVLENIESRLSNIDYVLIEYHAESDRRKIDQILKDFYLYSSKSVMMNLGLVKYIHSKLIK